MESEEGVILEGQRGREEKSESQQVSGLTGRRQKQQRG